MIRPLPAAARLFCLCLVLAGCASFPELDAAAEQKLKGPSTAPVIAPIDGIIADAATVTITDEGTAALQARAAAMQARGAGLTGPVADPETVARLTAALPPPAETP